MVKIKVGIPRAFLYYKYKYLWKTFLKELNCDLVVSPETNKEILKMGINYSIDESCLSSKIYMGHVYYLKDKCDYLLIPRIVNYGKNEVVCTKFNALYDIVNNTFNDIKIINYNIDLKNHHTELKAFLKMGYLLKKNLFSILFAYVKAKIVQLKHDKKEAMQQEIMANNNQKLKILLVAHPYNMHDRLLGYTITNYLEKQDIALIYADKANKKITKKKAKLISKDLYWIYNKELIGAIEHFKNHIDGIILITTFPCGPDSLVNELVIRKKTNIPIANIVLDELDGEAGLQTRIESFIDIVKSKLVVKEK